MMTIKFAGRTDEIVNGHRVVSFDYEGTDTCAATVSVDYEELYVDGYPEGFNPWCVGVRAGSDLNLSALPLSGTGALVTAVTAKHYALGHHVEFES